MRHDQKVVFLHGNIFLAEIRLKTVERAQLILFEYRPSWPKFFQTGQISPKSVQKKPTMGRISANLDDIRPKSWGELNCARSTVFKRISAKKNYCVDFQINQKLFRRCGST
jgi:hypothetical protein